MVTPPKQLELDLGTNSAPCSDCVAQKAKNRHAPPHANLVQTSPTRQFSSSMGAADETDYKCRVCGTEWLHETGSCGLGWL